MILEITCIFVISIVAGAITCYSITDEQALKCLKKLRVL